MKSTSYIYPVFTFFSLLFACGQPSEPEPETKPELAATLQTFCQESSSVDTCKTLIPLYVANLASFEHTTWFKEKSLCSWVGIHCNKQRQITKLDLFSRGLSTLPPFSFVGLPHLKTLDIGKNKLTKIETNTFNGLSKLETLSLSENQLSALENNVFQGLSKLETLFLDTNQLTSVKTQAFYTCTQGGGTCAPVMKNLKIVSFNENPELSSLPSELCTDTNVSVTHLNTKVVNCPKAL